MRQDRTKKNKISAIIVFVLFIAVVVTATVLPTTVSKYVKEYEFPSVPITVYQEGYVFPVLSEPQNAVTVGVTLLNLLNTPGNKVYDFYVAENRLNKNVNNSLDSDGTNYGVYIVPYVADALGMLPEERNDLTFQISNYKDGDQFRLDFFYYGASIDDELAGSTLTGVFRDSYLFDAATSTWVVDPTYTDNVRVGTMEIEVEPNISTFKRFKKGSFVEIYSCEVTR